MEYTLVIIGGGLIFYFYRFRKYINKYLIPFEVSEFQSDTSDDTDCYTGFVVVFQEGYLINVRRYKLQGYFFTDHVFSEKDLKGLLSLTERRLFHRLAEYLNPPIGMFSYPYRYGEKEVYVTYSLV